jgi:hypothetical protein
MRAAQRAHEGGPSVADLDRLDEDGTRAAEDANRQVHAACAQELRDGSLDRNGVGCRLNEHDDVVVGDRACENLWIRPNLVLEPSPRHEK